MPGTPPPVKPFNPEDDADYQIHRMIARRGQKPATPATDDGKPGEQAKPTTPAATPDPATPPPPDKTLGELVSKALFRTKKDTPKPDPAKDPAKPPVAAQPGATPDPAPPAPGAPATPEPGKTIVTRGKKGKPAADPVAIATQAASAAATAAVKAIHQPGQSPRQDKTDPESTLTGADLHEYQVAKYMAAADPRFKGAETVVLDHIRKSQSYADRWEASNPGKTFNPNDSEHDDFFAGLQKPWAEHEFRMAEQEMAAERVDKRRSQATEAELAEIRESTARQELQVPAQQAYQSIAAELARNAGDGILDKISKDGWDKFMEADPDAAAVIANALPGLQRFIHTAVELDDPKGRVRYNPKDRNHEAWWETLRAKEDQYVGTQDDNGRLFATRNEYNGLTPEQRRGRWYMTTDHLISEVAAEAIENVKNQIGQQRERTRKAALALGFTPPPAGGPPAKPAHATNNGDTTPPATPPPSTKPVTPSDSGSPRIDDTGAGPKTPTGKALAATASILFPR